jgi:hypothetical protein
MSEVPFLGRGEELARLVHTLARGRHTLLVGAKGVGKSRLMREAVSVLAGTRPLITHSGRLERTTRRTIILMHCAPLGDLTRELLQALHASGTLALDGARALSWEALRKSLTGRGSVALQQLALESLEAEKYLVVLDDLDRITPGHQDLIEGMLRRAVVCAAVTHLRDAVHFRKIWSSFTRMDIAPLSEAAAEELARRLIDRYGVARKNSQLLLREAVRSGAGNPHRIRSLIWHGSREHPLLPSEIRSFRRESAGELFNMGPVYIFAASVFTLYKIFSIGLDNRESYIYFSAVGFFVYFGFRVFRNFFIFRPQRE